MSKTTFTLDSDITKLLISFEAVEISVLQSIGYDVRAELRKRFLKGQALFVPQIKDKKGRRIARYRIIRKSKNAVEVSAYPLNLYEKTHKNRGTRVQGKRVFGSLLPPIAEKVAQRNLVRYITNFAKKVERKHG